MESSRFKQIVERYPSLRIVLVGDFCLDRYLEIDPAKQETSLETGLPVHNVVNVRAQPGGAGTILNNLTTLGIGSITPIGFAGNDGEGFELCRAIDGHPRVTGMLIRTDQRRTFTYCKPLVLAPNKPPIELNRLDSKNWTPTPSSLEESLAAEFSRAAVMADAVIILDQVDIPETGVVTARMLQAVRELSASRPGLPILADSRSGLGDFPPVIFKMNSAELSALTGAGPDLPLEKIKEAAACLAERNNRTVFVTLSERGIVGATPGQVEHVPALPLRGPIDIVGAGDAVTANLASALAAGAGLLEALELANAAASIVIHKLGTTGTASTSEILAMLLRNSKT